MPDKKSALECCLQRVFNSGRIMAAAIDVLSPDQNSLRLPDAICPFKMAIIPPADSSKIDPELASYAISLAQQLDSTTNLHNEVFYDDRTDYSIGKRLLLATQLGCPLIFWIRILDLIASCIGGIVMRVLIISLRTLKLKNSFINKV